MKIDTVSDFGIKISKEGKSINSSEPDDYIFWTKYKSLMLIEEVSTDILSPEGETSGSTEQSITTTGFFPLVMAFKTNDFGFSGDMFLPWSVSGLVGRFGRYDTQNYVESIGFTLEEGKIVYSWTAYGFDPQMGNQDPPTSDYTWNVTAYIYNLELGRELPD
jgi:hypothetical protein